MKLGIMQPYFLPYLGFWQLINAVDKYIIYDDVNYIKGGWINRNSILVNKKANLFTIPLAGASPNLLINEINISFNEKNKVKLLKTIDASYRKAPYFSDVYPIIKSIIMYDEENLAKYLFNSITLICSYLEIKTELLISSDIVKVDSKRGKDKVIHICELMGATEYYNAIGGKSLYNYEEFEKHDITLKFVETREVQYSQFADEYKPNLSILDVLMMNSKETCKKFLNSYKLITKDSN